jgi:hypothetical protein
LVGDCLLYRSAYQLLERPWLLSGATNKNFDGLKIFES